MGEPLSAGCEPGDGGTPGGDTVRVTSHTRYHTLVGIAEKPEDMSANPPYLLVPDGGTFTRIDGTPTDGGYQYAGVPQSTYYLRTGSNYILTDARHVELGSDKIGRSDAVLSGVDESPMQLDLSNLAPWVTYGNPVVQQSWLEFVSGQLSLAGNIFFYEDPVDGQTSVSSAEAWAWNLSESFPVVEAAKGDSLYVTQLGAMDAGTLPDGGALTLHTVVRSLELAPFDFTPDGVTPLPLGGVMQPVPTRELSVEWRLSEHLAAAGQMHPSAVSGRPYLFVDGAPHRPEDGWLSYSGSLVNLPLPAGASHTFTRRLSYGDPFPSSWARIGTVDYSMSYRDVVPDGSGQLFTQSIRTLRTQDRLDDFVTAPIVPRITPPRGLTIDGLDANVQRQVGAASPVIAWQPPDVGTPTAYHVGLYRLTQSWGTYRSNFQTSLRVPGSTTQVRLPPGTLLPGSIYYVEVMAVDITGHAPKHRPFQTLGGLPQGWARTLSSLFTTP
ncbi:fibronectin type III domain-containing protein [Pyxidicoccus sp. 3LG]